METRTETVATSSSSSSFYHPSLPTDFWDDNRHGLKCWSHHKVFTGPIYSYPTEKAMPKWKVWGVFCSLPCVQRYVYDRLAYRFRTLFTAMCVEVYGVKDMLMPVPQFELMEGYCPVPKMTIPYDKFLQMTTSTRVVAHPPFVFEKVADMVIFDNSALSTTFIGRNNSTKTTVADNVKAHPVGDDDVEVAP